MHLGSKERPTASSDLALILFSFELDMFKAERMPQRGLHLVIVHRHACTAECAPGEEIATAWFLHRNSRYQIPLSTTHLVLLDYLCRHRGIAQTATQISQGLSTEPFYIHHAANSGGRVVLRPRTSRTAVKEQIMRLRAALGKCLVAASIPLNPAAILCSKETSSNEVRYSIHAQVSWEH